MKLSALGLAVLAFIEEFRGVAYPDQGGVWTCGYGHTGPDVREGTTCTPTQALLWLAGDVGHAETAVNNLVKVPLAPHQFDALVMLTYNIGAHAFSTSTLLELLNSTKRNLGDIATQFLVWDKVRGLENVGLERRRSVEKAFFLDGVTT